MSEALLNGELPSIEERYQKRFASPVAINVLNDVH